MNGIIWYNPIADEARCEATAMDDGSEEDLRDIERELRDAEELESGHVSTFSILMLGATVLAWETEICVLVTHVFIKKNLDPLGHAVLLAVWGTLTLVSWFRGKQEYQKLAHLRGRIPITSAQAAIITVFVIAFGSVLGFIMMRFNEN